MRKKIVVMSLSSFDLSTKIFCVVNHGGKNYNEFQKIYMPNLTFLAASSRAFLIAVPSHLSTFRGLSSACKAF